MPQFHLKTEQVLQGDFTLQSLNLILIFQVNCPGCFIYALPLATKVYDQYGDRINILGLSTAFEDFELNTAANTQKLLQKGEMVGVTQQYFQRKQVKRYSIPLKFAIAFDRETFYLNGLPGTPTWILCDHNGKVLDRWFGHKANAEVEKILHRYLESPKTPSIIG